MGVPPRPGIFDWRRQVMQMVMFVAFIGALGYAVSQGAFDYMSNEVSLTVEANRTAVDFAVREAPVIQLHVKLKNNTGKSVTLEADSACKVLKWVVLSLPDRDLIQARGGQEVACPDARIKQELAPGQEIDEIYALELNPDRFKTAGDYEAHVKYWGYVAIVPFSVKLKK